MKRNAINLYLNLYLFLFGIIVYCNSMLQVIFMFWQLSLEWGMNLVCSFDLFVFNANGNLLIMILSCSNYVSLIKLRKQLNAEFK